MYPKYTYLAPNGVVVTSPYPKPEFWWHEWPPFYYFWSATKFLRGLYSVDPKKIAKLAAVQAAADKVE